MNLTKRGEYALRTLIRIGLAQEMGRPSVAVPELANIEQLPARFVEQIILHLKSSGYLADVPECPGHIRMARDMAGIPIAEIIRLMDGRLAPIACASEVFYEPCTCPDEEHCGLRMLMIDVRNAITSILERFTLANVVEVTIRKFRRDGIQDPFAGTIALPAGLNSAPDRRHADPEDGFLALLSDEDNGPE